MMYLIILKYIIMSIHRGQPVTVNWTAHRPVTMISWQGFRTLSQAWRTSSVNFMLTLATTNKTTKRCWT